MSGLILGALSVVATFLAVGLSIATFRITNRRDDLNWRRDAILDAMVQFLDASFQRYSERAYELKRKGALIDKYHDRADDARRQQNLALSRLRILASDAIVQAAQLVRIWDEHVERTLRGDDPLPTWSLLNEERQNARTKFIDAYRKDFGLGDAVPIPSGPPF